MPTIYHRNGTQLQITAHELSEFVAQGMISINPSDREYSINPPMLRMDNTVSDPESFMGNMHYITSSLNSRRYKISSESGLKTNCTKYRKDLNDIINKTSDFINKIENPLDIFLKKENCRICFKDNPSRYLQKVDNQFKVFNSKNLFDSFPNMLHSLGEIDKVKSLCFVRVKSCSNSIKIFGYGNVKKNMLENGENYKIAQILPSFKSKKDGKERDVIEVTVNNRNVKFLIEDLEFIFPDINLLLKGYTAPKNREIKIGSHVKLIDNRKIGLPKNVKLKIEDTEKIGSKTYCIVNYNNKTYPILKNKLKVI